MFEPTELLDCIGLRRTRRQRVPTELAVDLQLNTRRYDPVADVAQVQAGVVRVGPAARTAVLRGFMGHEVDSLWPGPGAL
jgi:hypothetical protein